MSVPEFVVQTGVHRAWSFLRQNTRSLGYFLRELEPGAQEGYRQSIRNDIPFIGFGNGDITVQADVKFLIACQSENEGPQGQYLGNQGNENVAPRYVTPNLDTREVPEEDFEGMTYGTRDCAKPITVSGPSTSLQDRAHPFPQKNLHVQRHLDTERYEQMGYVQRLFSEDDFLSKRSVGDQVSMAITVITSSFEKTMIYSRLLRNVLRSWYEWFEINGLQNIEFSFGPLAPAEDLQPLASGGSPWRREITIRFYHEDFSVELHSRLKGWVLAVGMATKNQSGVIELSPVATIESESVADGLFDNNGQPLPTSTSAADED